MKKTLPFLLFIIALPLLISQKPAGNNPPSYVEGQIMVKFRSDLSRDSREQAFHEFLESFRYLDIRMEEQLSDRLNIVLLSYDPGKKSDGQALEEIRAFPYVELAQFNHYVEKRELIPSDTYFNIQWNMHNTGQTGGTEDADIDGPEAWSIDTSGMTATGDEILVAIVDDGFDLEHEDLLFWKNTLEIPGNSIDDDTNGYIDDYDGWNSWLNSGTITAANHGTHVTGIACARGNNGLGVAGVNFGVRVLPVLGSATIESVVVAAYAYIFEMRSAYNESGGKRGAFVVSTNASFGVNNGDPEDFPIWGAMYDSLGSEGILSIGATANSNMDIDETGDIPTAFPSEWLITVTNTDKNDQKNSNAAYGDTTIDLGAPGTLIYSTMIDNQYGYKSGCSMSAPHVTGAVAFLFSVAGEAFMEAYHNDPAEMALVIKQYILDGVDPIPSLEGRTVTGGRLNIYKAAMQLLNSQFSVYISSDRDTLCAGESVYLSSHVLGGTGNYIYSWSSDPAGFNSSEAAVTFAPGITTTFFLEVSDDSNNTCLDSILITVKPLPGKPLIVSGPASVDNFISTSSFYSCLKAPDAVSYLWTVTPSEAGIPAGQDTACEFQWTDNYTGAVAVTVTALNDCGTSAASDSFLTSIYSSAGLVEDGENRQLVIFPNPAGGTVRFSLKNHRPSSASFQPGISPFSKLKIELYDVSGIRVLSTDWPEGQHEMDLNAGILKRGIYSARLRDGDNLIAVQKLIIIR